MYLEPAYVPHVLKGTEIYVTTRPNHSTNVKTLQDTQYIMQQFENIFAKKINKQFRIILNLKKDAFKRLGEDL